MRHWFFKNDSIVRYEDDDLRVNRSIVRVYGTYEDDGPETPHRRVYHAALFTDGQEQESTDHDDVYEAMKQGEQWLP